MKRALSVAAVALCWACATPTQVAEPAQPAKAEAPVQPTEDPAPRTEGDVTEAWIDGMQVLVKRVPGAELVAAQLNLRGGVRNWTEADAGVEKLALAVAVNGGTQALAKDAFVTKLASMGSAITSACTQDGSSINARSLLSRWDDTFGLMVDAFLSPALPVSELELQKRQQLAALLEEKDSPDGRLALASQQAVFAAHPYANRPVGTEASVGKLDLAAVTAHLAKLREKSRLLLVVVGDVDPAHVLSQARAAFGPLPRGSYVDTPIPPLRFAKPKLEVKSDKLPTTYVMAVAIGPGWADAEFPAAVVAMNILQKREFLEVRTKRNLSYAPAAFFARDGRVTQAALYVTAVDPNATMKVMLGEARRLKTEPVPQGELKGAVATHLTHFLVASESMAGQAGLLSKAELLTGNWRSLRDLPARLKMVTPAQVQTFAQKYLVNLRTTVLGDPAKVDAATLESL